MWTDRHPTPTIAARPQSTAARLSAESPVHHLRRKHTMALGFVHLHLHSAYSLLEGALPIARLADLAKADRQAAVGLTDTNNMFGALAFSDKMAADGIQPISACTLSGYCCAQNPPPRWPALRRTRQPVT